MKWLKNFDLSEFRSSRKSEAHAMPQPITSQQVEAHTKRVFRFLFKKPYLGEVFLCGGAYKPLLDPKLKINDLDLWVRNRKERIRLVGALVAEGARVVHDFAPYCIKLEKEGRAIEITYQNVKSNSVPFIVQSFDLGCCAIGARYYAGKVDEIYVSRQAQMSLARKKVYLNGAFLRWVRERHPLGLLSSLDRIHRFAQDIGFSVDTESEEALWELFETEYDEAEQQKCLDTYMEIVITYKSRHDTNILRRASNALMVKAV
jgi:hypothetical protein